MLTTLNRPPDKACSLEHPDVLRNSCKRDGEWLCQGGHRGSRAGDEADQAPTQGMRDRGVDGVELLARIFNHLVEHSLNQLAESMLAGPNPQLTRRAMLASDKAGFNTGRKSLQQALGQLETDATAITSG